MNKSTLHGFSRREFLAGTSMLGAATLLGLPRTAAAGPPPETTKIRLVKFPAICLAPQYLAEELLRLEGFSQVEYVSLADDENEPDLALAAGRADLTMEGATPLLPALDRGRPIVVLAGVHGGCYELFGNERVRAIRDLKGKGVAVWIYGAHDHIYVASMLAYVGIDPRTDVKQRLAHLSSRGHAALSRASLARSRHDQIGPQQTHRAGHRLAVPERTEKGVEGLNTHDGG